MKQLTGIDFFCGAGGSSLGAQLAGVEVLAAVNHWLLAATSYRLNHGGHVYLESVQSLDPADLPRADVLMFSPECTNHSRARGARVVDEMSRATALEVVRFVRVLKPELFVVENVPEITEWTRFFEWVNSLQELGYGLNGGIIPGQVIDARDCGVPQRRLRWFLVGARGGRRVQLEASGRQAPPVADCIDWDLPMRPICDRRRPLAEATRRKIEIGRQTYGDAPFLVVYYSSGPPVAPVDRPCRTVTTRDRFALVADDGIRMLQPEELLRVQGFPPGYRLAGNRSQRIAQIGNAVPPPMMAEILRQAA